ncbi:MAG TPA: phytoene/squalene synthase family protein [Gemmataceae bacterium]|nr:phytoene/squalene synthase family protein [Gemmataceae bacterium]
MTRLLARSYSFCERLARREAGNFYHAFRVLPVAQRRSMCALYSFLRVTDDLIDGLEMPSVKRAALSAWRREFDEALAGHYQHPLHAAFHDTMRAHAIPREYIDAVLDGVEMDLEQTSYATFAELYEYCYRVASAVGLACIHIWGFAEPSAKVYAESAGVALQITNILRDLREDAERGRVYLPREDLERFGYREAQLREGIRNENFRALMTFEVGRAREYYAAARPLSALLPPAGRAVFQVMTRTYEGLLNEIVERDYDVFTSRVSLSRWRKLGLVVQAMPARWGWT